MPALAEFTGEDRKALIDEARRDPAVHNTLVIKDEVTREPILMAPCHVRWLDAITHFKQLNLISPPEHGKTQNISVGFVLWLIGNNPNIRIVLVHRTAGMATKILKAVDQYIRLDKDFQSIFPWVKKPTGDKKSPWASTQLTVERDVIAKEPTLTSIGTYGPADGSRYDVIILDDPLSFENTRTQQQRDKLDDWVRTTLYLRITKGGYFVVLNNAWHPNDLTHRFKDEGWPTIVERAIEDDGTPLWSPQWTVERLEEKRKRIGARRYAQMFESNPMDDSDAIIEHGWIRYVDDEDIPDLEDLSVYMSYDPSTGKNAHEKKNAHFSGTAFGVDESKGVIYVLDSYAVREKFPQRIARIVQDHVFWGSSGAIYEDAGQQIDTVQHLRDAHPEVKPIGWPPRGDKMDRLERATLWMQNRLIFFVRSMHPDAPGRSKKGDLVTALLSAPDSTNLDMCDSFSQGVDFIEKKLLRWVMAKNGMSRDERIQERVNRQKKQSGEGLTPVQRAVQPHWDARRRAIEHAKREIERHESS